MQLEKVIDTPDVRIYRGLACEYTDTKTQIDLVITNPYGYLPGWMHDKPMLLHQWGHRKNDLERWIAPAWLSGSPVAKWNHDKEMFWAVNIHQPKKIDLSEFVPTEEGWYPEDMVRRIFDVYVTPGMTIWDGFMGRGTVGKIALERGCRYVAVEQLEGHIAIALQYLGLETPHV